MSYPILILDLQILTESAQRGKLQTMFNVAAFPSNIPGHYLWSFAILDNTTGYWRIYEVRKDFSGRFCALRIRNQDPQIGGTVGLIFAMTKRNWLPEVYERCRQVPVPYLLSEADCSRQYVHDVLRHLSDVGILTSQQHVAVMSMMNHLEVQFQYQVMGLGL
ncbi:hypothetical protein FSARC_14371 [Fusarium sarcochroum]|uniref:Uncharacterized protein n=1 Tax=Fusarium sarcochroum TaxID=1208366 RepID=A0A8H4WPR4_9HYPO|nr:hypothetical protein FSARC_14371 [Fusarium sarcochroum]